MGLFGKKIIKYDDGCLIIDYDKYQKIIKNSKKLYNGIPVELLLNILNNNYLYSIFIEIIKNIYFFSTNYYIYKSELSDNVDNVLLNINDVLSAFELFYKDNNLKKYKDKIDKLLSLNLDIDNGLNLIDILDLLVLPLDEFLIKVNENSIFVQLYNVISKINYDFIFSKNDEYLIYKDKININLKKLYELYKNNEDKKNNDGIYIPEDIFNILNKYEKFLNKNLNQNELLNEIYNFINSNVNLNNSELLIITNYIKELELKLYFNENLITNINEILINEDLKKSLLNEIPSEFSKLQKIYYIYRRLCQKLSYDEEYLTIKNKNKCRIKHNDIGRLAKINDENYKIVCFEGTFILGKFCEFFDIPFYFLGYGDKKLDVSDYIDGKHIDIKFKIDDYIVKAQIVANTIENDLTREKMGMPIENFCLVQDNNKLKEKFDSELAIVDSYIEKNRKKNNFIDAREQYKMLEEKKLLNNDDKLKLLMDSIKEINLDITDLLRYVLQLKKIIFKDDLERCVITFVKNKNPRIKDKKIGLMMIISFFDDKNKINYYMYENGMNDFEKISKRKLQMLFDFKILSDFNNHMIPGVRVR